MMVLAAIGAVLIAAVVAMLAVAGNVSAAVLALVGSLVLATPRVSRRLRARDRRRLARSVGDPAGLTGAWRRLLAGAWTARDQFSDAVAAFEPSPLRDRLAEHQPVVDAALERCGRLARDGDALARHLRGFRTRRLRYELGVEQRRDADGPRARALADRLDEVERLAAQVDAVHRRLEAQVHDLRTAAWRARALRAQPATDDDAALADLLADLVHLRDALVEVDDPTPTTTDRPDDRSAGPSSASQAESRYDVRTRRGVGG